MKATKLLLSAVACTLALSAPFALAQAQIAKLEKEPLVIAGGDPVEEEPLVVAGGDPEEEEAAAPSPESVEGDLNLTRENHRLVQMGLSAEGYSPGPADGRIGRDTRAALRRWQASKEVEATGYLTREQAEGLAALGREESERVARDERQNAHSGESDHRFRWKVISDSGAK